ncbi:MAG: DUF1292 domain-containing protein [Clostridia bacterium]|nr:DUF1292 domain-containing protein [Clostridia bacterium]
MAIDEMNNEELDFEVDLLTLVDDEGVEHEFEIVDEIETDDGHYIALIPTAQSADAILDDAGTYYIFEIVEEDGEEQLMELEDDETLNKVDAIFQERFNSEFFEEN